MKQLIAIDGNSLLYRAYYALPDMATRDGIPTGALHGFLTMLLKLVENRPDYLVVAFDMHVPTFRHKGYGAYKAGRKETPEDLKKQFPILKELLSEMRIAVCECAGFEADDILGTFARCAAEQDVSATLVTGDRDALQLVSAHTRVILTKRGLTDTVEYTPETLMEQYGLTPERMRDLKGLMGDASDNIPGVPGVGEKTALKLLGAYGDLESVLTHADEIKGKLGEKLRDNADSARLSLWLGTIDTQAPLPFFLDGCTFDGIFMSGAADHLRALELRAVLSKLPNNVQTHPAAAAPACKLVPIDSAEALREVLDAQKQSAAFALEIGEQISFAFSPDRAYVISTGQTLFEIPLSIEQVLLTAAPLLTDPSVEKLCFHGKALRHTAALYGIPVNNIAFDAMIADYLLNAVRPSAALSETAERYLNTSEGNAAHLFSLRPMLERELSDQGMTELCEDMELPLSGVLFGMEQDGFRVDSEVLRQLQKQFETRAAALAGEIYGLAGEQFNILSPKQLGSILFEKLMLPPQRKTKSGYSTDAETLDRLTAMHPIVALIQEYRFLTKLKSTFIDGLLMAASAEDNRVRTLFQQCVTATGRLSSTEPNLQNIPVRSPLGREIRKAFIASEGNVLVGADYSQIELRILAHLSRDEGMIRAFQSGEDIHRHTASEVFGVPLEAVTGEMRSAAKAVNFGIVYGISDFGLSQNLSIPVKQAGEYIRLYLERYPGIQAFMDQCVRQGKSNGYAVTMFGRRRALPELKSGNYNTRSFGERVAMNMPIQGSAADVIKLAMIRVSRALADEGLRARLILQVHDELILDVPKDEEMRVRTIVRECMENVCALRVPLIADVRAGHSWYDTK